MKMMQKIQRWIKQHVLWVAIFQPILVLALLMNTGFAQIIFQPDQYSLYSDTSFHRIISHYKFPRQGTHISSTFTRENGDLHGRSRSSDGKSGSSSYILRDVVQLSSGKQYHYNCIEVFRQGDSLLYSKDYSSFITYDIQGFIASAIQVFGSQDTIQEDWFKFDSLGMLVKYTHRDCNSCGTDYVSMSYEYDDKNRLLTKQVTDHVFGAINPSIVVYYHTGILGRTSYQVMYEFGGREPSEDDDGKEKRLKLPLRYRFVKEDPGADRILDYRRVTNDRLGRLRSAKTIRLGSKSKLRIHY